MSLKSYLPLAILAPAAVVASLSSIVSAVGRPAPPSSTLSAVIIRLEGEVREVFGNKVIVDGPAGRVLVETGPEGRQRALLAAGDKVVVDGLQRDGFVHASAFTKAGGPRIELGRGPDAGPGSARATVAEPTRPITRTWSYRL
jgi:multidrug efflux pump subunit AcrA (membrane-fusion protein)